MPVSGRRRRLRAARLAAQTTKELVVGTVAAGGGITTMSLPWPISHPLEVINVVTHFWAILPMGEMLRDLEETWSLLLVLTFGMIDSLMYHMMELVLGEFGGWNVAQWNLADHITAQSLLILTPVFFIGIPNPYLLHGYVFFIIVLMAVFLNLVDVVYFVSIFTPLHLLASFMFMWDRWAVSFRDLDTWAAFFDLILGLVFYLLDDWWYDWAHPLWHTFSLLSLFHFMRVRHKYFGFGKNKWGWRSEFYRILLTDLRRETTWWLIPSYLPILPENEEWADSRKDLRLTLGQSNFLLEWWTF